MNDLGALVENWSDTRPLSDSGDPYLNFLQIFPTVEHLGIRSLQLRWASESSPDFALDHRDSMSVTFTQPGCITKPHTDGYGCGMRIGQLSGSKLWIVWPMTSHNFTALKRDILIRGAEYENRLQYYIDNLHDMEVFFVPDEVGLSFDLPGCVIHACLS